MKGGEVVIVCTTGAEKIHLSVVLSCSVSGTLLLHVIIFKGKRELKDIVVLPGFIVIVQENGWMVEKLTLRFIKEIWMHNMGSDSLLVWDSFCSHITEAVIKELHKHNVRPEVIPGGCTSKAQPLDVSLNKPFKGVLRTCWVEYIANQVDSSSADQRIKTAPKQVVMDWIVRAWNYLRMQQDMICKTFLVTGITNALDFSQDDIYHQMLPLLLLDLNWKSMLTLLTRWMR